MPSWTAHAEIPAPPETVFAYLADPTRVGEWEHTGMIVACRLESPKVELGATAIQTMKLLRRHEVPVRVVEYEPGRVVRYEKQWPFFVSYGWRLEPAPAGTKLTYEVEMRPSGFVGLGIRFMGHAGVQRSLQTDLVNIGRHTAV